MRALSSEPFEFPMRDKHGNRIGESAFLRALSFSMVLSIPLFLIGLLMWYVVGKMDRSRPKFEALPTSGGAMPATTG